MLVSFRACALTCVTEIQLPAFREKVEMQPAGTAGPEILDRLLAKPEFPGMSRPLWLVMAGSIPTALGWCVE